ncbi:hypothetical protein DI272_32065 [Streptomyces sp. Act143]|uniref:hypothetical protein n=1 Tax=Streptomyces sp. Act143 TaxID=2200760 RepID=UPI000D67CA0F|nr:hypothetical protein [Streptomyces sp. Act143]PWI18265.1 hypothetical protein DI272_32065 [Streptomyces sp. Act143]
MTTRQLRPRTAVVRPAGLVDVPAVVRLVAPPVPAPGSVECLTADWDQAQRAMRLLLAHHALEEGQVWVAERRDGELLAAAVWMPPDAGAEPSRDRLGTLFARELAVRPPEPPIAPILPTALKGAGPAEPHWTVVIVCAQDDTEAWEPALVAELLAPGLAEVDAEAATAVALTLSARHTDQLRSLGFRRPRHVPVSPGLGVWLTTRCPEHRLAA